MVWDTLFARPRKVISTMTMVNPLPSIIFAIFVTYLYFLTLGLVLRGVGRLAGSKGVRSLGRDLSPRPSHPLLFGVGMLTGFYFLLIVYEAGILRAVSLWGFVFFVPSLLSWLGLRSVLRFLRADDSPGEEEAGAARTD